MGVPYRRYVGRLLPKSLRPQVKAALFARAYRRFHGRPRSTISSSPSGETATLSIIGTTIITPIADARGTIEWLKDHPEDLRELEVFLGLARRADGVMLDVGAHIGTFAALFCKSSQHGALCFEPVPGSQAAIAHIAALNQLEDRIKIVRAAVGCATGTTALRVDRGTGFAAPKEYEALYAGSTDEIVVATTTIDAARETSGKIGLIKIDVEGFEAEVLEGAKEALRRDQPPIALELHTDYLRERGLRVSSVLRGLEEQGYSCLRLDGRRIAAAAGDAIFLPRVHLIAVPQAQRNTYAAMLRALLLAGELEKQALERALRGAVLDQAGTRAPGESGNALD